MGAINAMQQRVEVLTGELPLEGLGNGFVVTGEAQQPLLEGFEGREVVGCQGLALKDGEVDLHLIQPTG